MSIVRSRLSACLAAAAVGLLAGCASSPTTTTANEQIDYAKMAQIERAARYFGTQVIWVNYPTKRVETTQQ